jgi:hypothetical protein
VNILKRFGLVLVAIGITACSLTPAQQQSALLYQQAVASGQRPTIAVGVVKTYDPATGVLQLDDTTTYLVPASTGGHQMPTDVVGPLIANDHVRLSYVRQGGQRVVINLEKENIEGDNM